MPVNDNAAMMSQVRARIQHYQQQQQQHPGTGWTEYRPKPPLLLVYDDSVCLLLFACEAFLWRGVWNLNATFMIADLFLGGWINHAAGTVIMMTLQLFSYVGVCGCAVDDDTNSEEGQRRNSHNYRPTQPSIPPG